MNAKRREAISALLDGMADYIPVRDISAVLGIDLTTINRELAEMEMHGLAESCKMRKGKGSLMAWRLKDDDGHAST